MARFKSRNPGDYIFCIIKMDFLNWCAAITPAALFAQEGCLYDQHVPLRIDDWDAEMEGIFGGPQNMTPEQLHADLLSKGVVYSRELAEFMDKHDTEEVFMPA